MKCEWPKEECSQPAVAKVGLPGPSAIWLCERHFEAWRKQLTGFPKQ